jgi:integrase
MGLKQLGPKRWQVRAVITDRRTGKKKERERICNGPEREARELYQELRKELLEELGGAPRQRLTLGEFSKCWLKRKASEKVRRSTLKKYATDLRLHILPRLGDRFLDTLLPSDIAAFMVDHAGAPNSKLNRLRLLRTMAKDALADRLIRLDFCARVRAPEVVGYTEEEPNLLSADELAELLEHVPEQWRAMVTVAAFTGLRWGELSALRWEDLDREAGLIRVRRNNWKGKIGPVKTRRARRDPPLSPPVERVLAARRRELMRIQHPGFRQGWIFPAPHGGVYAGNPLCRVLSKLCISAELTEITPHGLRRTYNDLLRRVADGMVVRSIIGHADQAMTEAYSQVDAGEKRAAAAAVVELVLGKKEAGHEG